MLENCAAHHLTAILWCKEKEMLGIIPILDFMAKLSCNLIAGVEFITMAGIKMDALSL